jgi:hypothetical protein
LTKRKAQNSFLVLTTLGVYLGLLMVGGAAPQVLAHSATTRNFEITDEIEVKDDLDNKPDDERTDERSDVRLSLLTYFQDVEYFVRTLQRLGGTKYFDAASDSFEVNQSTQLPCVAANKVGSYTANKFVVRNEEFRPWLESFSKRLTDGYSLGDCLPNSRFAPVETTDSKFNFRLDKDAFAIDVAVRKQSPEAAKLLAGDLADTFAALRRADADAIRQKLYEATKFRSENDQIFVVTHMARAALDPLLAKDAK